MNPVPIGVFDHVDRRPEISLKQTYEDRLRLVEAYDRAGFHAYQIAEHHATPLAMAPSPGVFLSLVAQRTERIRFGPMVYVLPLHHPLRLLEEVCMLDQLSGGRFELGVGRGVSPLELKHYGVDPGEAREIHDETLEILLKGLAMGAGELTHRGRHFDFENVPVAFEAVQRPHPPVWVGVGTADGARRAGAEGRNVLTNSPLAFAGELMKLYAEAHAERHGGRDLPKMAVCRHIYVAPTDAEAVAVMRVAYRAWWDHFIALWKRHGADVVVAQYEEDFDASRAKDLFVVGSPATVAAEIERSLEVSGTNYFVARFAYGSLTYEQSRAALDLFVEEVMPKVGLAAPARPPGTGRA